MLIAHPRVADVAVVGVPDDDLVEQVKAIVQPVDWAEAGPAFAESLRAFCREHLAGYKVPRTIDFERELPRGDTGKLAKGPLRDRYWAATRTDPERPEPEERR